LQIGGDVLLHFLAVAVDDIALGQGLFGDRRLGHHADLLTQGGGALRVVLDLTREWNKVCDTQLITGVTVVRTEYAKKNPDSDVRLGQNGDGVLLGSGHLGRDLRGLAVILDLQVPVGVEAVFRSR